MKEREEVQGGRVSGGLTGAGAGERGTANGRF